MSDSNDISPKEFWQGRGGNDYTERHLSNREQSIAARVRVWQPLLQRLQNVRHILEIGANIGDNLAAISILTNAELHAIEPNDKARRKLKNQSFINDENVYAREIEQFQSVAFDLVFTCGVLIHVSPGGLSQSCLNIYDASSRYICIMEYFAPQEEEIEYQGQRGLLWRRDYGSIFMDNFKLRPMGCGFLWKRTTGMDNLTWWMFEKI